METSEEYRTIDDVRKACEEGRNKAIEALLKEMEELGQDRVRTATFLVAYNTRSCGRCGSSVVEGENFCYDCRKTIAREKKTAKIKAAFEKLTEELNFLASEELYHFNGEDRICDMEIRRTEGENYCGIYRKNIYARGSWHSHRSALKIRTSDWSIDNSNLQKDFGAKHLAAGLHKSCDKLMKAIFDKRERTEKVNKEKDEVTAMLRSMFPAAEIAMLGVTTTKLTFKCASHREVRIIVHVHDGKITLSNIEAHKEIGPNTITELVKLLGGE